MKDLLPTLYHGHEFPGQNAEERVISFCWIWYLFCEAAAEETLALVLDNEKPREELKTENNNHINLKVAGQDGYVVQFKIQRRTPLSKLMKAYCERQSLSRRQVRFRFEGQPIDETDTPAQLEMEDEDTTDVFQQQTGGVY
ncbi:small ubiquitin-related modifier 2-like [Myotis daubentonii]|uniref:small ubiquitin-related modifier 2-like n=1 Tax=Myotis daubentonii TaxID=98922 RepID=UPI002872E48D|nr:small ubiquitin-related modifier 2-like [Myotis daubentonii]